MDWSTKTVETFLDAAHAITPLVLSERVQTEKNQKLSPELVGEMRRQGFFSLALPKVYGGPELTPAGLCRVVEVLSAADGSVGWCAGIASATSRLAAYLPKEIAERIFGNGGITAGTLAPTGIAIASGNGFQISGRWSWGSGIHHSDWVIASCRIMDGQTQRMLNGLPETRMMLVPKTDVEVLDTWDVAGLRGTGSHDFRIDDLFVPEEQTLDSVNPVPRVSGTLYAMPFVTIANTSVASVPLGIARTAIDALIEVAKAKVPVGSTDVLKDKSSIQMEVARAEAMWRSARAFLYEALDAVFLAGEKGKLTLEDRALSRLGCAHSAETSQQITSKMFNLAGAGSIREAGRMARCWRDVHATTLHAGINSVNFENVGRVMMGMEPPTPRF